MGLQFQPGASPAATPNIRGYVATRSSTGVFQKEQWEDEIWRELSATYVMASTVVDVPQEKISGKVYRQPKVGRMATRAKVQATPVILQAYNESEFTMEFKRYQETSFAIEDSASIFMDYDLRQEWNQECAIAIARDVDNWILGHRVVVQKAGRVVDAGASTPLNRATLLAAQLLFDQAFVPQTDRMWMFAPAQFISLLTINEFVSGDYIQGSPTMTGEIGTLYGNPVIVNNNILKNSLTGLQLVTGTDGSGNRVFTNTLTPGVTNGTNAASPYYPKPGATFNNDPNGAGNHPELVITDTLPVGRYTGMLLRKGWIKHGWALQPKTEMDREITLLSDLVVISYSHDAKLYRPEYSVLIHSGEAG